MCLCSLWQPQGIVAAAIAKMVIKVRVAAAIENTIANIMASVAADVSGAVVTDVANAADVQDKAEATKVRG